MVRAYNYELPNRIYKPILHSSQMKKRELCKTKGSERKSLKAKRVWWNYKKPNYREEKAEHRLHIKHSLCFSPGITRGSIKANENLWSSKKPIRLLETSDLKQINNREERFFFEKKKRKGFELSHSDRFCPANPESNYEILCILKGFYPEVRNKQALRKSS